MRWPDELARRRESRFWRATAGCRMEGWQALAGLAGAGDVFQMLTGPLS
jgi:hypothetical protein